MVGGEALSSRSDQSGPHAKQQIGLPLQPLLPDGSHGPFPWPNSAQEGPTADTRHAMAQRGCRPLAGCMVWPGSAEDHRPRPCLDFRLASAARDFCARGSSPPNASAWSSGQVPVSSASMVTAMP
ncbi:hypothetical protein CTU88_38750 [Streptomyces sp. JV178]|nr:hypothetical protein CTU88_38750 [Streptomyces sp. JV178]